MRTITLFKLSSVVATLALAVGLAGCPGIFDFIDKPDKVAAPANLAASASATSISIALSWTVSTTSGATYKVYRGTAAGTEAATPIGTSATKSYMDADSALQPNTTYYYVRAVSGGVESARSNEAHATTMDLAGGPGPTVTFYRVDLSVFYTPPYNYDLVDQCAWLTWPGPSSGVSYTVLRSTDPEFSSPEGTDVTDLNTSGTGYANGYFYDESAEGYDFYDNTALLGQTYYYIVFEIDEADGGLSLPSDVVTAGAPAPANVTAVENVDGTVTVSWDAVSGASDYSVYVIDPDGIVRGTFQAHDPGSSMTLSDSDFGFQSGTYYFTVQAYLSGWGYYSLSNALVYTMP